MPQSSPLSVLCVDDNVEVAEALRVLLSRAGFRHVGWLASAEGLIERAERDRPDLILLDVDMPGPDPLAVLPELCRALPEVRVIVLSGHIRRRLVDTAIERGAWGYVSKNDGEGELLDAIRAVAAGEFVLSSEVQRATAGDV